MATTLSPAMERAMRKLTPEWACSYTLRVSMQTLWALRHRGLVNVSGCGTLGSAASPRTRIKWRLTERGEQWLKR